VIHAGRYRHAPRVAPLQRRAGLAKPHPVQPRGDYECARDMAGGARSARRTRDHEFPAHAARSTAMLERACTERLAPGDASLTTRVQNFHRHATSAGSIGQDAHPADWPRARFAMLAAVFVLAARSSILFAERMQPRSRDCRSHVASGSLARLMHACGSAKLECRTTAKQLQWASGERSTRVSSFNVAKETGDANHPQRQGTS
jgi:hypothetical protein